jgi:hypothetical protein
LRQPSLIFPPFWSRSKLAPDVLRHRVLPSWEAQADGLTPDALVGALLGRVPVPVP